MAERATVSLFELARDELQAAWERKHRAERELAAFLQRHDGQKMNPELRAAYERELHMLRVEADDAVRQHAAAKTEFARHQKN